MSAPDLRDLELLIASLPSDWEQRMAVYGLLSTHPAAKFRDAKDLLRYVLLHVGADLPLRQTCAVAKEAGLPECTHAALHFKMRRMGPFLHEMVERMTTLQEGCERERWSGYQVVVVDGSVVVSPGPTGDGGRLHIAMRLSDATVVGARVTTTSQGETLRNFDWEPEQLVVVDRGYASPPGIAHAVARGADVLARWCRGSLPLYDDAGEAIDVLAWLRGLPRGHAAHHVVARVIRDDDDVAGRLIAVRLPADKLKKARERAIREHGHDAIALEFAQWLIVFTTAPIHRLTDAQAVAAYRLRWQVELLFKRWKSLCRFDYLPNYRPDTLVSWLYAKLLLALCLERIGTAARTTPNGRAVSKPSTARTPFVLQPWKMTSVIWPCILATILPLGLHTLLERTDEILSSLERSSRRGGSPMQVREFRKDLGHRVESPSFST